MIFQVNAELGVRFGVSLNQGNLSFMEDTATCLANAFEVNRKTSGFKPPGALLAPADPVPIGTPEEEPGKGTAAYFAVFDGKTCHRNVAGLGQDIEGVEVDRDTTSFNLWSRGPLLTLRPEINHEDKRSIPSSKGVANFERIAIMIVCTSGCFMASRVLHKYNLNANLPALQKRAPSESEPMATFVPSGIPSLFNALQGTYDWSHCITTIFDIVCLLGCIPISNLFSWMPVL